MAGCSIAWHCARSWGQRSSCNFWSAPRSPSCPMSAASRPRGVGLFVISGHALIRQTLIAAVPADRRRTVSPPTGSCSNSSAAIRACRQPSASRRHGPPAGCCSPRSLANVAAGVLLWLLDLPIHRDAVPEAPVSRRTWLGAGSGHPRRLCDGDGSSCPPPRSRRSPSCVRPTARRSSASSGRPGASTLVGGLTLARDAAAADPAGPAPLPRPDHGAACRARTGGAERASCSYLGAGRRSPPVSSAHRVVPTGLAASPGLAGSADDRRRQRDGHAGQPGHPMLVVDSCLPRC